MPPRSSRTPVVTVVDGSAEVQQWINALVEAGRRGAPGDWPHPHPALPHVETTVEELMRAVGAHLGDDGAAWSLQRQGLPPLPGAPSSDPSKGSAYHNLLHSLLGDFH